MLLAGLLFVPTGMVPAQTLELSRTVDNPAQAGAGFGHAMASLGDVDGDGAPDFVVGAPFASPDQGMGQGQVFVVSGATGAFIHTVNYPDVQAQFSSATFGWSVAGLGDVNGDGIPDFAVGAPGQSTQTSLGTIFVGRVFVFSGSNGGWLFAVDNVASTPDALFGWAIAAVGDLNGDGVRELAVGAPAQGASMQGQVVVFSGANGARLRALENPTMPQQFTFFGGALTSADDVNGDGVDDIAVGAPEQNSQGRVFVFSGADGASLGALDSPTPQFGGAFGEALALMGDVNGDGLADLAVGAPGQNQGNFSRAGQVFVFGGVSAPATTPFSAAPVRTLDVPNPNTVSGTLFGRTLAAVGDFDGDGLADVAVGARDHDIPDLPGSTINSGAGVGQAYVFTSIDGGVVTLDIPVAGPNANAGFGHQVVAVENASGGERYLAVSAPNQNVGTQSGLGQVFVYALPAAGGSTPPPPPTNDTTPPTLTVLPHVVAEATSPDGAVVHYPSPTVTDDQDPAPAVACAPAAGSRFPLGASTVRCTATDRAGNGAAANFTVTVRDSTAPQTTVLSAVDGNKKSVSSGDSTLSSQLTVKFGGSDAVGVEGYYCSWDGEPYSPCTSPLTKSNLRKGRHVFGVWARDGARNGDDSPATLEWTILTKGQAVKELKRSAKELELSRREWAKLHKLLREIKERLTDRRQSNDKKVCDELGDVMKLVAKQERAGVLTSEEGEPLRHMAESLKLNIGCRVKSWHAGHRHR